MIPSGIVLAEIILGGRQWLGWAVGLVVVALVALVWAYTQTNYATWVRALAALLKTAGIVLLAVLLLEPLFTGTRPRPGSNLFLVVADNSKSLQLADRGNRESRGVSFDSLGRHAAKMNIDKVSVGTKHQGRRPDRRATVPGGGRLGTRGGEAGARPRGGPERPHDAPAP